MENIDEMIGELHIFEQKDPNGAIINLHLDLHTNQSLVRLLDINHPTHETLISQFEGLKQGKGINPEKIYIDIWSSLPETLSKIWPDADLLYDYLD